MVIAGTLGASYTPATYKTTDGQAYFMFKYIEVNGFIEIHIIEQPEYDNVDDDLSITHRLPSDREEYKICFSSGKEPKEIELAKGFSMAWAEYTWNYIKTGVTIDDQISGHNANQPDQKKRRFQEAPKSDETHPVVNAIKLIVFLTAVAFMIYKCF